MNRVCSDLKQCILNFIGCNQNINNFGSKKYIK